MIHFKLVESSEKEKSSVFYFKSEDLTLSVEFFPETKGKSNKQWWETRKFLEICLVPNLKSKYFPEHNYRFFKNERTNSIRIVRLIGAADRDIEDAKNELKTYKDAVLYVLNEAFAGLYTAKFK